MEVGSCSVGDAPAGAGAAAVTEDELTKRDARIKDLEERLAKAEKEKPNMDKWFEENIEGITKKFNEYGVDMKIRNKKQT